MKLLKLEFFKCRRRKIVLVCAAVLAAELLWFGMYLTRQDAEDLVEGWMMLFYNLALIDAIFLPISVAVIASRNCELEHKGATLKLLETMVTPGRLYCTKMLWGALVLATLLAVRSAAFAAMGAAVHFSGDIPWGKFALFTVISWAVSMMVFALQQGLSLRFVNQAVSLVCGIFGSFIGIMSMLFPDWLVRIVPWGYYGLLSLARMEWDPDTRFTQYFWRWPEPLDVALLLLWAALFFIVGRTLFVRRDVSALSESGTGQVPPVTGLAGICAAAGLSCHSGNRELPGEYRGPGKRLVQSVEPTHPVFLHVLSARPLECILRVAVEAGTHGSQLEQFPHRTGAGGGSVRCQADSGRCGVPSGSSVDWGPICPQWKTGRYLRAVAS